MVNAELKNTVPISIKTVRPGQVVEMEPSGQTIKVVQGRARIALGSNEFTLKADQQMVLFTRDAAQVTPIGNQNLILTMTTGE